MTHAMSKNLGRITFMDIYNPITNNKTNRNLNETGPNGRVTEFQEVLLFGIKDTFFDETILL